MAVERVIAVGGGVAGCSAALEAAKRGLTVTLIDEHPQSPQAMSLDTPYFYGARLAPAVGDARVVGERVLGANALLRTPRRVPGHRPVVVEHRGQRTGLGEASRWRRYNVDWVACVAGEAAGAAQIGYFDATKGASAVRWAQRHCAGQSAASADVAGTRLRT